MRAKVAVDQANDEAEAGWEAKTQAAQSGRSKPRQSTKTKHLTALRRVADKRTPRRQSSDETRAKVNRRQSQEEKQPLPEAKKKEPGRGWELHKRD